jgi:hypothetical protein
MRKLRRGLYRLLVGGKGLLRIANSVAFYCILGVVVNSDY